ncbi:MULTISPECIES: hypothetical protein [Microbacterium]|uniref:Uncharacterized protein n=1 Tax=Microbacterium oleivorans TaxID=273677 RepID=A0A031FVE5_9MICO|nr:hypothetical protein [Microbacterium oleivorans]AZS42925.1 hypothetical protein BWL13_00466 [Microbacterium oleivorans]EZP28242.1 hypothetical protein BW34_01220 [Microbacterium oleivorans]THE08021.1 hypothetical protein E1I21_04755 [Microbacterium oleivorans]
MKRIDVHYGGALYSIGEESFEDFAAQVSAALEAGHGWIVVNDGEGAPRPAHLLISPGVPIALIPIPDESSPEPEDAADGHFIP